MTVSFIEFGAGTEEALPVFDAKNRVAGVSINHTAGKYIAVSFPQSGM